LPLIYEACQADQFAYEYEHGVTSYGAFTYTLSRVLRQHRLRTRSITFTQLLNEARTTLHDLNYDQVPTLLGPAEWLNKPIPWAPASGTPAEATRRNSGEGSRICANGTACFVNSSTISRRCASSLVAPLGVRWLDTALDPWICE